MVQINSHYNPSNLQLQGIPGEKWLDMGWIEAGKDQAASVSQLPQMSLRGSSRGNDRKDSKVIVSSWVARAE